MDFATSGSTGGVSPDYMAADFTLTTDVQGKWSTVSLTGGAVPPSYAQLVFLITDSSVQCEPDTLGLAQVVFSDPEDSPIPFCGSIDEPCPAAPEVSEKEETS